MAQKIKALLYSVLFLMAMPMAAQTYPSACTNLTTIQLPSPLPNFGNLIGANILVKDPEPNNATTCFHNPIVRVTDANTSNLKPNVSYGTGTGGSGDENLWNTNSTLFLVGDFGCCHYPYSFNPVTMQAARLYATSKQGSGLVITRGGSWSYTNSQVLYTFAITGGTGGIAQILKYDFTNRVTPPTPTVVANFKSGGNALPTNYNVRWSVNGFNSKDDLTFAVGFSGTGGQNTGCDVAVWRNGSGFSHLNTCTGAVTGDFGSTGTVGIADRFTIHNVKIAKDGTRVVITPGTCQTTCKNNRSPYAWTIGSTTLAYLAPVGTPSGGHFTEGYTHWINASGSTGNVIRPFSSPSRHTLIPVTKPPGLVSPFDVHQGWNNVDANDTVPFLITTTSMLSPFPSAWYNEVQAISPLTGTVWRFAHTYTNGKSQRFETAIGAGSVSQDGNFFIFSSDIGGTLGSESGTNTCTLGTNCRGDVFIVSLNPGVPSPRTGVTVIKH